MLLSLFAFALLWMPVQTTYITYDTGLVDLQHFATPPGSTNFIGTQSAVVMPHLAVAMGALADYSHNVFRITAIDTTTTTLSSSVVSQRLQTDITFALGLFDWVELGLVAPAVWQQGLTSQQFSPLDADYGLHPIRPWSAGDLQLMAKIRLVNWHHGVVALAVLPKLSVPLQKNNYYVSESGINFIPSLLFTVQPHPVFRLGFQAGYRLRHYHQALTSLVDIGDEWQLSVAMALDLSFQRTFPIELIGEFSAVAPIYNPFGLYLHGLSRQTTVAASALEAMAGFRLAPCSWRIHVGIGNGLYGSVGTATPRAVVGLSYVFNEPSSAAAVDQNASFTTTPLDLAPSMTLLIPAASPLPLSVSTGLSHGYTIIHVPMNFNDANMTIDDQRLFAQALALIQEFPEETTIGIAINMAPMTQNTASMQLARDRAHTIRRQLLTKDIAAARCYLMKTNFKGKSASVTLWLKKPFSEADNPNPHKSHRLPFHILRSKPVEFNF